MIHFNSTTISSNPDMKLKGKELNEAFNKEYNLITDSFRLNIRKYYKINLLIKRKKNNL